MKLLPQDQQTNTLIRELGFDSCKVISEESRSIEVTASTAAIDSHGEIVEQDWDLSRYLKNPVVLWNHQRHELPIGKASNVRVEGGNLKMVITFASEKANPQAEQIWLLAKEDILKGVSVGFRPGEVTSKFSNGREIFVLSKCELRETSMVSIGSNPETVSKDIDDEHNSLAIFVAAKSATNLKGANMKTAEELQAELDKVRADSEKSLSDERSKALTAEKELSAEKTLSAKLEAELKTERERNAKAAETIAKSELDLRQAKKFLPAEREELDALVKDIGIDRVCKLLDVRGDIALTKAVVGDDGLPVSGEPPAEKAFESTGASASLATEADKRARS
jgi:HK97 family phage prohead protease